ncbi:MAG: thioesterase family protein [Acidobacteriota bacterium]
MAIHRFTRDELVGAPPAGHSYPHTVRLQEVDAAGVVFFGHYLALFNDALLDWMDRIGLSAHTLIEQRGILAPVKHAEADYLAPARFGDRLMIELVCAAVESTQFTVGYRVSRRSDLAVLAVGQTAHVFVEATSFQRVDAPPELRAALQELCDLGS